MCSPTFVVDDFSELFLYHVTLQFSHIYSVCGKTKVFFLQSFELAMQDSHPSLYSTKTLYHLNISDPFWYYTKNVDCFIKISLEYTQNYIEIFFFFEYQGKVFLNIENVLAKISEKKP